MNKPRIFLGSSGKQEASPRDNVVFEAGLFGPTDLLGLTCVRHGDATIAAEVRAMNQKLRKAIESEGRIARIDGLWWQFSLTERSTLEGIINAS